MVLQGTKPSFDLEILLDVSANDTNRDRKSYPYIYRNECKSRVGISFALPHSELEHCLLYDRRINPILRSFEKRNAKCHSSGFYDSATNFTLSGQLITAASVYFCSNT